MRRYKCLCILSPFRWNRNPSVCGLAVILASVALLSSIFNRPLSAVTPAPKMAHKNVAKVRMVFQIKDWSMPLAAKNESEKYYNEQFNGSSNEPFVCDDCFDFDFVLLISPTSACKNKLTLLIMIHSRPSDRLVRTTIRKTWASKCDGKHIQCLFVFGNGGNMSENVAIRTESNKYNDVLQYDFVESYENLTYKTMLTFKWASHYCRTARYVMKTDDDTFINIGLLLQLMTVVPKQLIGGFCRHPINPNRTSSSKWFTPVEVYPYSYYPRYCLGSGYIVSMNLVSRILTLSHHTPYFVWEDIYLGMIVRKLDIMPIRFRGFHAKNADKMRPCVFNKKVITIHKMTRNDLEKLWEKARKCGNS